MDLELKGKKAIITGGSRGIGKSVALSLASEGVDIGICSRFTESLSATASEIERHTGQNVFFFGRRHDKHRIRGIFYKFSSD